MHRFRQKRSFFIAASTALMLVILLKRSDEGTITAIAVYFTRKYPFTTDYCNFLDERRSSDEGRISAGAKLVSVTVVLRHGDRFHMESSRLGSIDPPRVSCKLSAGGKADSLVTEFINVMSRRTASAPSVGQHGGWGFSPYPNSSVCTPEMLSPTGVRQHLRNGAELRNAYEVHLNLSSVKAKSTAYERTYQSALAFLFGLNPELYWSQLELERVSNTKFCSARVAGSCACPRSDALARSARAAVRQLWQREDSAYLQFAEHASRVLGSRVTLTYPLENAFDFLSQFACRKLQPPCHNGHCFLEEHLRLLRAHLRYYSQKLVLNSDFQSKCRIESHPLLTEIARRFKSFVPETQTPASAPRVVVYSGHDVTVTPLLVALGIPLDGSPPFASRLVFEQHLDSKANKHYVRVLFNGADVTRGLRFHQRVNTGLCPLESFLAFAERDSLGELGFRSWSAACFAG